jgi:hypothetical protein
MQMLAMNIVGVCVRVRACACVYVCLFVCVCVCLCVCGKPVLKDKIALK